MTQCEARTPRIGALRSDSHGGQTSLIQDASLLFREVPRLLVLVESHEDGLAQGAAHATLHSERVGAEDDRDLIATVCVHALE